MTISDENMSAVIAMAGTVVVPACVSCVMSILAYLKSKQNNSEIRQLHVIVNNRLTELLKVSIEKALAEGFIQGGKTEQSRGQQIAGDVLIARDARDPASIRLSEIKGQS